MTQFPRLFSTSNRWCNRVTISGRRRDSTLCPDQQTPPVRSHDLRTLESICVVFWAKRKMAGSVGPRYWRQKELGSGDQWMALRCKVMEVRLREQKIIREEKCQAERRMGGYIWGVRHGTQYCGDRMSGELCPVQIGEINCQKAEKKPIWCPLYLSCLRSNRSSSHVQPW